MPHLRELVKLYDDQPFALIGVNTGDDEETFRMGLTDYDVSWITAYQGKETPIADQFRVDGYPTYFLIGPDGRIISTGHSSKAMDAPIKKLMDALKKKEGE